MCDFKTVQEL